MSCIGEVVDCIVSAGRTETKVGNRISRTGSGSGRLYYISRTSTATDVDCVISLELVLGQWWTVSYQ